MKKILLLLLVCFLTACKMNKTPSDEVSNLLTKYISNDPEIVMELDDYINSSKLNKDQGLKYKEIYLKQFKDLKYKIKKEDINNNRAVVLTRITVYDYYNKEVEANKYLENNIDSFKKDGKYDEELFVDYKLDLISKTKDRIDYDIEFTLTKINNKWILDDLTNELLEKIHGVYAY